MRDRLLLREDVWKYIKEAAQSDVLK